MSVTFQQDANGYKLLQTRNAQLRGARIMPLAFVQPSSSADVSAAVRCSVQSGLRFVARNGEWCVQGSLQLVVWASVGLFGCTYF
jgi:FAD/FMN-containing dehydrogenase